MLGAIIGDTIGSVFEFDNYRKKDFELFSDNSKFTDDSIMTLAVMEIMQKKLYDNKSKIIEILKKWGNAFPYAGYGGRFANWLTKNSKNAYNSYGNGAAMRISPVAYYANSEEEVKGITRKITEVTHNHTEGLKGAEVTAMCIYYAKMGKTKEFIKEYASKYYNLDLDYEKLRKNYYFNETCQETVPQAIYCFLISNDFEDCIRTSISIGGDSDTLAAISCAIAEAYYKYIPQDIISEVLDRIPSESNGCNPNIIISKYMEDRINVLSSCEEIMQNTIILAEFYENEDKQLVFHYSKSLDILIDYIIDKVTYIDDSLEEYCIDNISYINSIRNNSISNINLLINQLNGNVKIKFKLYENPIEAIKDIGEKEDVLYDEIFKGVYTIKNML